MVKQPRHSLNVNLSASQVRKRLKGHGFGVKDVQATDRNQSVIIHTATRQHLDELRSLFADVLPETREVTDDFRNTNLDGDLTRRDLSDHGDETITEAT